MMRLFPFFNFLLFISPFYAFLFKGSCSSKSILFIYSYFFTEENTVQPFFSSQNNIWRNIIYTHCYSLHDDHFFPMLSSGDDRDQCVHSSVVRIRSIETSGWLCRIHNLAVQHVGIGESQSVLVFLSGLCFSTHPLSSFFKKIKLQLQTQSKTQSLNKSQSNSSLSH